MWNTILWVAIGSTAIASAMEFLKHTLYKDNATTKQMTIWAGSCSVALAPILYYGFELIGKPMAMIFYAIALFLVQKELDMKAIRPIVKKLMEKKMGI